MTDHANAGYRRLFEEFSVGLFFPITTTSEPVPPLEDQLELARYACDLGFDALWFRDVPLFWPPFGDAGQVYDPWVFLSHIAAHTEEVALVTGSIVLPLRHPLHVAKAAASVDRLSDGRLVLGVASGDRPPEFPAFGVEEAARGELFRESIDVLRTVWAEPYPELETSLVDLDGSMDLLPKPTAETLPLLVTGHAQQSLEWIGDHADGWVYYQRDIADLEDQLAEWREVSGGEKPYVQVLHVGLEDDPTAGPEPVHQGYAAGSEWFAEHLRSLADCGVDHVVINIRRTADGRGPRDVLERFASEVLEAV
ncbi:LLM class oxidoreductase [Natronobiforma cellulositropha]|uniref:LLM class oxidoreductase n=1 Tax=Natronobiforma cellulositropha TaxID=1679076 RepID=UPI0021D57F24|nr:LLM class oxidoreductase [Natronobiforma cellulositropha]